MLTVFLFLNKGVAAKSDKLTPTVFNNKTVNDLIAGKFFCVKFYIFF